MRDLLLGFRNEKVLEGTCSRGRRSALHRKTQREKPFDDSRVDKKMKKAQNATCFGLLLYALH